MANRWGKVETVTDLVFLGSKIIADNDCDCSHGIKRHLFPGRKPLTSWDSMLKSRDVALLTEVCLVKAAVSPVVMYACELDHKEGWAPKNWCFSTVVLEKTLESPLDNKEIKPINPKGNQSWIFTAKADAEAEASRLWLLLLLSHFSCVRLCAIPSLGFSRQEHWSGVLFPSPMHKGEKWKWSSSVMSNSSWPHGL